MADRGSQGTLTDPVIVSSCVPAVPLRDYVTVVARHPSSDTTVAVQPECPRT